MERARVVVVVEDVVAEDVDVIWIKINLMPELARCILPKGEKVMKTWTVNVHSGVEEDVKMEAVAMTLTAKEAVVVEAVAKVVAKVLSRITSQSLMELVTSAGLMATKNSTVTPRRPNTEIKSMLLRNHWKQVRPSSEVLKLLSFPVALNLS